MLHNLINQNTRPKHDQYIRVKCEKILRASFHSPKFSPPQISMAVSNFPKWLNQDLLITNSPPGRTGVLGISGYRIKSNDY